MTGSYAVIVAPSARGHAQRIDEWWRENRPKAPDLFARELEAGCVARGTRSRAAPLNDIAPVLEDATVLNVVAV